MPASLAASIDIDAPPSAVWSVVSDLTRMKEWSPQCVAMKPLRGHIQRGTRTLNLNRRGLLFWPTTATVTEFEPERAVAFRITENKTVWSFTLDATATGTRLTQRRDSPNGGSAVSSLAVKTVMGGTENFDVELTAGMHQTLERIKAAVEKTG